MRRVLYPDARVGVVDFLLQKAETVDLFGNFSFRTGYLEMRCSKSCYLYDLELVDLFDNSVIEQVYYQQQTYYY